MPAVTTTPTTPRPDAGPPAAGPELPAPRPVRPAFLLRAEGAALAAVAVALFARTGVTWWLFAVLALAPDLGLLGYLAGRRIGAAAYNLTHNLALPLLVGAAGLWAASPTAVAVALVWVAHIGVDRAAGYGLKYPTDFADTHLQRVADR